MFSFRAEAQRAALVPVAKYYVDAKGVRRSTGKTKQLRQSQSWSQLMTSQSESFKIGFVLVV